MAPAAHSVTRKPERNQQKDPPSRRDDLVPGAIPVLTYRDYFDEYRAHPEHKALSPSGDACHPWTRGLLRPPAVRAARLQAVGKETIVGTDDASDPSEPLGPEITYRHPTCPVCGRPLAGKQIYCSAVCSKRAHRITL
jgi:hypothetical protein